MLLRAPGDSGHEVRLDQPGENLEVGGDVFPVHADGRALRRVADHDERGRIVGVVRHDSHSDRGHPVVDEAAYLRIGHDSVRAGGHEDADALRLETRS